MKINLGRKLYSVPEAYWILYKGLCTVKHLFKAKRSRELNPDFIERIMLAVTEVNGCAICSYAHTKMALEAGMSNEEIQNMLSGVFDNVPTEEMAAIMFAQHYADCRGNPSQESWEQIVELYSSSKAKGILGAIRMIMIGNTYGIPWSSFFNRFKGKPDERSNVLYEISMITASIVFTPIAIVHALISKLFRVPIISFERR